MIVRTAARDDPLLTRSQNVACRQVALVVPSAQLGSALAGQNRSSPAGYDGCNYMARSGGIEEKRKEEQSSRESRA